MTGGHDAGLAHIDSISQVSASPGDLARLAGTLSGAGLTAATAGLDTGSMVSSLAPTAVIAPSTAWQATTAIAAAAAALAGPAAALATASTSVWAAWVELSASDVLVAGWMAAIAEAADTVGELYRPASSPSVRSAPATEPNPPIPDSLADLLSALGAVNDATEGQVEIQTVTIDGIPHHVLLLPGTDDPATLPWNQDDTVRDLGENLLLISGAGSSYVAGLQEVLAQAGVSASDPVLIVGHSQGGMAGMALAATGEVNVVGVLTAGSPIGGATPIDVPVVSLEHSCDVVPSLDGGPNPATPTWTTVTFTGTCAGLTSNHSIDSYLDGAAAVDAAIAIDTTDTPGLEAVEQLLSELNGASGPVQVRDYLLTHDPLTHDPDRGRTPRVE